MLELITLSIIAFMLGYIWGKIRGLKQGKQEGQNEAPLLFRQYSLEKGYCLLCHQILDADRGRIVNESYYHNME